MTLLLAALALLSPNAEPKLNYTTRAVPLSKICEDLSQQTGMRLRVTDDLASEPVVIRFVDVPLKEGMAKIAETVRAEWVEGKDSHLLTRTQRLQQKLEEEEFQTEVEDIRASQMQHLERVQRHGAFDLAQARQLAAEVSAHANLDPERQRGRDYSLQWRRLSLRSPLHRLISRVYSAIDPALLASLPDDERVMLSTRPTPVQRFLEVDPAVLADFEREQALFAEALVGAPESIKSFLAGALPGSSEQPAILLATVHDGAMNIYVTDSNYKLIASNSVQFGWDSGWDMREEEQRLAAEFAQAKPIELSPLVRSLADRLDMTMGEMKKQLELSPKTKFALLNPERHDPLSLSFSELFLKTAERDGLNVVAYGPDVLEQTVAGLMLREPIIPERILLWVARNRSVAVEEEDGWLTCFARLPNKILTGRMPRDAFGPFVRRLDKEQGVTIENTAQLALAATDGQIQELAWQYATLLQGKQVGSALDHLALVRFYSSLTPLQRDVLESYGKLGLSDLNPEQIELVRKTVYLYGLQSRHAVFDPGHWEKWASDLRHEPTIAFPNGLPPKTEVVVKALDRARHIMMWRDRPDGFAHEESVSLQSLAVRYAQSQRTDLFPFAAEWQILYVTPARVITLDWDINLSEDYASGNGFEERRPKGPPVSFEQFLAQMTDDDKQEWERLLVEANGRWADRPPGTPQPVTPPPPPRS